MSKDPEEEPRSAAELTVALVTGMHQETIRVTNSVIESEAGLAFDHGFAEGFQNGYNRAKYEIRQVLDIRSSWQGPVATRSEAHELAKQSWLYLRREAKDGKKYPPE